MTRVKSAVLVDAAMRYAGKELIDCVLVHRGDADAGAIFVHIDARDGRHQILARSLDFYGSYNWHYNQHRVGRCRYRRGPAKSKPMTPTRLLLK